MWILENILMQTTGKKNVFEVLWECIGHYPQRWCVKEVSNNSKRPNHRPSPQAQEKPSLITIIQNKEIRKFKLSVQAKAELIHQVQQKSKNSDCEAHSS